MDENTVQHTSANRHKLLTLGLLVAILFIGVVTFFSVNRLTNKQALNSASEARTIQRNQAAVNTVETSKTTGDQATGQMASVVSVGDGLVELNSGTPYNDMQEDPSCQFSLSCQYK